MGNDLEIKIRTTLDGNGLKLTDDQLKSFSRSSQAAEQATARTGRAAKDAGDAIHQFGRRGSEAKDAFEGLSNVARGGEGAIFGLAKAWRALTAAFAANPITAALALILGLLPLIQKGFDLIVASAEKSRDAMAGSGEQVRAVEKNVKELQAASDAYLKKTTEEAAKLKEAWSRINAEIDGTLNRFKQVEGARADAEKSGLELARKKALAGAKTQEQRDKINADYDAKIAGVDAGSKKAIALQEDNANMMKEYAALETADSAKKALDEADAKVAAARENEQRVRKAGQSEPRFKESGKYDRYGNPIMVENTTQASLAAGNALRALQQAEQDREAVRGKYESQYLEATRSAKDANASLVASKYRNQSLDNEVQIGSIDRQSSVSGNVDPARMKELRANATAAQARGDFAGQAAAVSELQKMTQAARTLSKAVTDSGKAVTSSLEEAKKATQQTKAAIKRTQQAGPGGGG